MLHSTFINDSTRRFSVVPFRSSFSPFSRDLTTSAVIPIDAVSANHSQPSPFTFDPGEVSTETVYTKELAQPDLEHKIFSEIILLTSVRSSLFFNQNSVSQLANDDDDCNCAKYFLNLVILEEMVKEKYLEDPNCEVLDVAKNSLFPICRGTGDMQLSVVGKEEEATPPWKIMEEDEVMFVDLCGTWLPRWNHRRRSSAVDFTHMIAARTRAPSRSFWFAFAFSILVPQLGQPWVSVHLSDWASSCSGPIFILQM